MKKLLLVICFIVNANLSEAQRWSSAFVGKPSARALYASNVAKAIQNAWENELNTKDKKDALLDEIVFGTSSDFTVRQDITDNSDKTITSNIDEIAEASGIVEIIKDPIKKKKEIIIDGKTIVVEMNTAPVIVEETIEPDTIYAIPQTPAIFTGGQNAMRKFFEKNIQIPEGNGKLVKGKVFVRFMVDAKGQLSRVYLVKGLTEACNKEALRVVKMMPMWIPAMEDGENVNSWHTLPIYFEIK
ncbi:MAG: energy transducer TonB [Arcicella sp.]|nr:energy transducer TonB [Arcicella sp.]